MDARLINYLIDSTQCLWYPTPETHAHQINTKIN